MAGGKRDGAGRKAGVPNRLGSGVKSNIVAVFDHIGGRDKMAEWALSNQTEFYKLYGRLLPTEIGLTGEGGGPIVSKVEVVLVDGKS